MPDRKCSTCAVWARVSETSNFGFCEWAISPAAAGLALPVSVTTSVKRLMCGSDGDECAAWGGASND